MSALIAAFTPSLAALGVALLHSVWQIAVIGLGYAAARRWARSPALRHNLGLVCLVLAVAVPTTTFLVQSRQLDAGAARTTAAATAAEPSSTTPTSTPGAAGDSSRWTLPSWQTVRAGALPLIALLWAIGASVQTIRLGLAALRLQRWRSKTNTSSLHQRLQTELTRRLLALGASVGLSSRRLHRIRVRVLSEVIGPCTFGLFRTTLVVPASVCSGLSPAQLDQILLHELNHVRRYDAWFATLQASLDCLLFFHPVAGWISRDVTAAREEACDDLVLEATANTADRDSRVVYAGALTALATLLERIRRTETGSTSSRSDYPAPTAMAAGGSSLRRRVRRILEQGDGLTKSARRNSTPISIGQRAWTGAALPLAALLIVGTTVVSFAAPHSSAGPAGLQEATQTPTVPEGIAVTMHSEIVALDAAFQDVSRPGWNAGHGRVYLVPQRERVLREYVNQTLSAPKLRVTVGAQGSVVTGISDPADPTLFRYDDGTPANAELEITVTPTQANASVVIANISLNLRPGIGTERRLDSDRETTVELNSEAFQRDRPMLLLADLAPDHEQGLVGIIVRFEPDPELERAEAEGDGEGHGPVTLAVKDADLREALETITRYAELEVQVDPEAEHLLNQPVSIQAVAVPPQMLIQSILEMNCLAGSFEEGLLRVSVARSSACDSVE